MDKRLIHVFKYLKRKQVGEPVDSRFIYLLRVHKFYKIGVATNVKERLESLQIGCPYKIYVIAAWLSDDARNEERKIHELLTTYRCSGEWFMLPSTLVKKLVEGG